MSKTVEVRVGKRAPYTVLVDEEDYWLFEKYKSHTEWKGVNIYCIRRETDPETGKRRKIFLHRQILGITDSDIVVDHENGHGLDCRKNNLRPVTRAVNNLNTVGQQGRRVSKYKGVYPYNVGGRRRWRAQILFNRRKIHIGCFDTQREAALAYDRKALELHAGQHQFLKLNFLSSFKKFGRMIP